MLRLRSVSRATSPLRILSPTVSSHQSSSTSRAHLLPSPSPSPTPYYQTRARVSAQSSPGSPLFHPLFTVSVGATGLCPQWPHNLLVWQTEQLSLLGGGLSVSHLAFLTFITFIIIPGLARKSQWTNEKELQKNWKMYRDKLMSQYCTARCLGIKSIVLNINWKYLKQSKNIWWHSRFSSLFHENIESMNWMNTYVRINSVKRLLRKIFPILNCFEK